MPAFRSVVSALLRELGDFSLHPQGRPCGRPSGRPPARLRHAGHRGARLTLRYRACASWPNLTARWHPTPKLQGCNYGER
jgi:hypothetical protein